MPPWPRHLIASPAHIRATAGAGARAAGRLQRRPLWPVEKRQWLHSSPPWQRQQRSDGKGDGDGDSASDPRLRDVERDIWDDYATLRENYETPKYPIVLAHGLLGFSELRFATALPAVQYWHGIQDALERGGATVMTASVPPSSSIEERAAKLRDGIAAATFPNTEATRGVNIIAHSMGGLDARYMAAHLAPADIPIRSVTTIATPHRGSHFADFLLAPGASPYSPLHLPNLYGLIERTGLGTQAFAQLTRDHMSHSFNPSVPDDPSIRYFSYGASTEEPPLLSPFRLPWRTIHAVEGPNDGLVSVESSKWGTYKGTLHGVSHLDLINWSNRMKWTVREWMGMKRTFNAIAFYLDIADMLAKEGL